jgi:hypothetical protein
MLQGWATPTRLSDLRRLGSMIGTAVRMGVRISCIVASIPLIVIYL